MRLSRVVVKQEKKRN